MGFGHSKMVMVKMRVTVRGLKDMELHLSLCLLALCIYVPLNSPWTPSSVCMCRSILNTSLKEPAEYLLMPVAFCACILVFNTSRGAHSRVHTIPEP